jgi:hypothetical protein
MVEDGIADLTDGDESIDFGAENEIVWPFRPVPTVHWDTT